MSTSNQNDRLILKPGRDKPVRQRHPWIYSGAIQHAPAAFQDGDIVPVYSAKGNWLASGYFNRASQLRVRLLSWQEDEPIDASFWHKKLESAIAMRTALVDQSQTDTYRLVNGESDFLPGLIVDRYGPFLVLQAGTLGIDRRKSDLARLLLDLTGLEGVIERSELSSRNKEGLESASGLLAGAAPDGPIEVSELGMRYQVDLFRGQKTGFYTDQRENRRRVASYCRGAQVLNAFSYTGAFAVQALAAGAQHVVNIDSSVQALTLAETNLAGNGFDPDQQAELIAGDVFQVLRDWSRAGEPRFDVIILDPPKFAHSQRGIQRALRGYKEINLLALRLLRPNGILATFSCSGLVSSDLFQKVIFGAATDTNRSLQIVERLHQGVDHPIAINFPEGEYLKGLICRVL
jgi:23S rRNA (cytosine1962-C5)-methyltransferase